ncbi:hypothetical protein E6C50_12410 [Flavobacterium supellecticarium]|uniref:Class IIb bacteriocin, lactobin A/cerein 7B family n=1 Tax=Flavobacterium supellecticarium TaxID=2565924 RepID=A0A4V3W822_9FLAO|nr:hypothetical protein [Flavobacterium supellecticarium]THF49543.1 hypothetical protein E6C50_12410 [Flavobacterium supellecticarium]
MKTTHHNKLAFAKNDLVELNSNQMLHVQGGTGTSIIAMTIVGSTSLVTATSSVIFDQAEKN